MSKVAITLAAAALVLGSVALTANAQTQGASSRGSQILRNNGIFIPASMAKSFKDALDKLSAAGVERYMAFQHGRSAGGYEKSMEVLDTGGVGMISTLESIVRTTIRRDEH